MKNKIIKQKIPSLVKDYPLSSVVISKLNTDKETANRGVNVGDLNFPDVSKSIKDRIKNNENIMQLFPDVELAKQILVSSILSPNDMLTNNLTFKVHDLKIPLDVRMHMLDLVKKHIYKEHDLLNRLTEILGEALFTKGAYIEAVIPEASVDELINPDIAGMVSAESYTENYAKPTNRFIGGGGLVVSNEDLDEFAIKDVPKNETITISEEDLFISITDNERLLEANKKYLDAVPAMVNQTLGLEDYSTAEEINEIEQLFRITNEYKERGMVGVNGYDNTVRESIGKPLVMKLPPESVIPVHVSNDPRRHLGYFLLLDNNGVPINTVDFIQKHGDDVNAFTANSKSVTNSGKLNIVSRAKKALFGIVKTDAQMKNLEGVYSKIVEGMLTTKIKNGMYGDIAEIEDNADIYRVMLFRALKAQKTRVLYLPKELVQYYAFEYRDNGTGKSLMEKVSMLFSIKSINLFTRLMANIKNSVTTTNISAELDEDDPNPEETMEKIISESLKTRQSQLPLGVTKIDDLVEWSHKVGFRYNFKHPGLPNMEISVDESSTSKVVPDSDLDDMIDEHIYMSFSLTPEVVKSAYESDFATTVAAKSLLLAKRIMGYQTQANPQITNHVKIYINNDHGLRSKLKEAIKNNLPAVKKMLKKHVDTKANNIDKIFSNEKGIINYVYKSFLDTLEVTLPSPEMKETDNMKEAFDNYKDMLDDYLDMIMSDDAIPEELMGDLTDKIEPVKAIMKTMLIRKWVSENGYVPEMNDFLTMDEEGNPKFDLLEEYDTYATNLSKALLPFLKKNGKFIKKVNDKLEKMENDEDDEEEDNSDSDSDNSTGDSNDDTGTGDAEGDGEVESDDNADATANTDDEDMGGGDEEDVPDDDSVDDKDADKEDDTEDGTEEEK